MHIYICMYATHAYAYARAGVVLEDVIILHLPVEEMFVLAQVLKESPTNAYVACLPLKGIKCINNPLRGICIHIKLLLARFVFRFNKYLGYYLQR